MGSPVFILRPESRGRVGGRVFSEFLGRRGMVSLDPQRALSKGGSCPAVNMRRPVFVDTSRGSHNPQLSPRAPSLLTSLSHLVPPG